MKKQLMIVAAFSLIISFSLIAFAGYDLKEITPAIRQAIENRQARYSAIQDLSGAGVVGENNRGYLELINAADSTKTQSLIESENQDRRLIYKAVAEQNSLGPDGLAIVETVFSQVRKEKASPGNYIQRPTGEWVRK